MSPGATMERVYLGLKVQIMGGAFLPGERLDPARLAGDLVASATPIRDALHRLSGERLIDSWHQEGFRVPIYTETDLRDLYGWAQSLLSLALRAPSIPPASPDGPMLGADGEDYPERIARLFRAIALLSGNRELRQAIANMVDRSHMVRRFEISGDTAASIALAAMEDGFRAMAWRELRAGLVKFHRRRLAHVGEVAALMRPREPLG